VEVGVRELRNHLSQYLDRVRAGEVLVVTDRGRAIARVTPMGEGSIEALIAAGLVAPAPSAKKKRRAGSVRAQGSVTELVAEQRR
jgi:prevent-host-death family protein